MRIARVFPSRTRATPDDELAFVGDPPRLLPPEVDVVHISVTFKWDLAEAERLARQWETIAPVIVGGPATFMAGGEFTPGMYVKHGYTITSRGCPNCCWFCDVWKREGRVVRELEIKDGWNVLDDNLLACSQEHIVRVLEMLKRQSRPAEFTGGLEAARFTPELAARFREIRPKQMFFAYDTPDDWEPLRAAAEMCWNAGFTPASHRIRAYVLCGWPKDTMAAALERMRQVESLGIMPMAMLWRDKTGTFDPKWRRFQRTWVRPEIIARRKAA